jgi:hypothetical protein
LNWQQRREELLDEIVATVLALNLPLKTMHRLLTGEFLVAVNALCTTYGGIPSYTILREHVDSAKARAVSLVTQQLHNSSAGIPPIFGVMTDNSSDVHGHCIVNSIIQHPTLGEVLVGSSAVTDDRVMSAAENSAHVRKALETHNLVSALPTNTAHRQLRDGHETHPCGRHLDHQCLSGVTSDNCNSALATATAFVEAAVADVQNLFKGPEGDAPDKPVVLDDDSIEGFQFIKEGCPAHAINLLASGDVLAFFDNCKRLLETWATLAGTQSRKRRHRLIELLGEASARRALDSDGQRWGDRLQALTLLLAGSFFFVFCFFVVFFFLQPTSSSRAFFPQAKATMLLGTSYRRGSTTSCKSRRRTRTTTSQR